MFLAGTSPGALEVRQPESLHEVRRAVNELVPTDGLTIEQMREQGASAQEILDARAELKTLKEWLWHLRDSLSVSRDSRDSRDSPLFRNVVNAHASTLRIQRWLSEAEPAMNVNLPAESSRVSKYEARLIYVWCQWQSERLRRVSARLGGAESSAWTERGLKKLAKEFM